MDARGIATSVLSISSPGTHFGDDAAARHLAVTSTTPAPRSAAPTRIASATSSRFPFPRQVAALAAASGTERPLYGSDCCWTRAPATQAELASIDVAPQPDGDSWRALTTRNAQQLFPRLAR